MTDPGPMRIQTKIGRVFERFLSGKLLLGRSKRDRGDIDAAFANPLFTIGIVVHSRRTNFENRLALFEFAFLGPYIISKVVHLGVDKLVVDSLSLDFILELCA